MNREFLTNHYKEHLTFLPDEFDAGLIGIARRPQTPVLPVYDYLRCVRGMRMSEGLSVFRVLEKTFTNVIEPAPLILYPLSSTHNREYFWEQVNRYKLVAWDNLTPAIIGLGRRNLTEEVTVYDYGAALALLTDAQDFSDSKTSPEDEARKALELKMTEEWLGPTTPYFASLRMQ